MSWDPDEGRDWDNWDTETIWDDPSLYRDLMPFYREYGPRKIIVINLPEGDYPAEDVR